MDVYCIDIDKYIEWYKNESEFIHRLEDYRHEMQRCAILSHRLNVRYLFNEKNKQSKALSEKLFERLQYLESKINDAKSIKELDLLYYPTPNDWYLIELLANGDTDKEEINRRLNFVRGENKIEALKGIRSEFIENWQSTYIDRYIEGKPLIKVGGLPSTIITTLGVDFQHIKAIQYIDQLINGKNIQPTASPQNNKPLQWIGKAAQLGFMAYQLADLGYIEPPRKPGGEINYNEFARKLLECFDIETTPGTLANAVNPEKNNMEFKNKDKFQIPHIKEIS